MLGDGNTYVQLLSNERINDKFPSTLKAKCWAMAIPM